MNNFVFEIKHYDLGTRYITVYIVCICMCTCNIHTELKSEEIEIGLFVHLDVVKFVCDQNR